MLSGFCWRGTFWLGYGYCGRMALHFAAEADHADIVRILLDKGANVHARDSHLDWMPLHHAANYGNTGVVRVLLARGADPEARDDGGRTPLRLAKEKGHIEVVEILRAPPPARPAASP